MSYLYNRVAIEDNIDLDNIDHPNLTMDSQIGDSSFLWCRDIDKRYRVPMRPK